MMLDNKNKENSRENVEYPQYIDNEIKSPPLLNLLNPLSGIFQNRGFSIDVKYHKILDNRILNLLEFHMSNALKSLTNPNVLSFISTYNKKAYLLL